METLTITDMVQIKNLLEVATQRGAWKASELSIAGATYDKLVKFIETVVAQQEEAQQNTQGEKDD